MLLTSPFVDVVVDTSVPCKDSGGSNVCVQRGWIILSSQSVGLLTATDGIVRLWSERPRNVPHANDRWVPSARLLALPASMALPITCLVYSRRTAPDYIYIHRGQMSGRPNHSGTAYLDYRVPVDRWPSPRDAMWPGQHSASVRSSGPRKPIDLSVARGQTVHRRCAPERGPSGQMSSQWTLPLTGRRSADCRR